MPSEVRPKALTKYTKSDPVDTGFSRRLSSWLHSESTIGTKFLRNGINKPTLDTGNEIGGESFHRAKEEAPSWEQSPRQNDA